MNEILWFMILFLFSLVSFLIGKTLGKIIANRDFDREKPKLRKKAVEKSRAILTGKFSEQISPYFPDFPYEASEARFIGSPVDFIIFKGMNEKEIKEVIFVEVKTGKSKLSKQEKYLKEAILNKKVKWFEYLINPSNKR
jgi:predicted Holliday junction resolvase-like endonuclease